MKKFEFDTGQHGLAKAMSDIFGGQDLSEVHALLKDITLPCVQFVGDQQLIFHKVAYANIKWDFLPRYHQFVKDIIRPRFDEPIIYQKVPSIRFQLPENKGVGAFHRDADYGHSPDEINFYVPLTPSIFTSTIWIEKDDGTHEVFPPMDYGDIMEWDGANLKHGNKINETGKTRVSIDFRVLLLSLYDEADGLSRKTTHLEKRFVLGDYFTVLD